VRNKDTKQNTLQYKSNIQYNTDKIHYITNYGSNIQYKADKIHYITNYRFNIQSNTDKIETQTQTKYIKKQGSADATQNQALQSVCEIKLY